MKAALFKEPGKIDIEEIEKPEPGPSDIILKVKACAVCGTDVRIFKGEKTAGIHPPTTIGHEFSGVVDSVGKEVEDYAEGDRLLVAPVVPCLTCVYCKNNRENACRNRKAFGYEYDGGFAEYVKIPGRVADTGNLFKIGPDTSFSTAALSEPLGCCINGNRRSSIYIGDTVVIIGAGPIGIMHLMLARRSGASDIIVSEPIESRRDYASQFGADLTVDPTEQDLSEIVFQRTDDLGADSLIMAIGVPELVDQTLNLVKKGGYVNYFAGFPKGSKTEIDPNPIHYRELNVTGTASSKRRDVELALSLIESGEIDAEGLVTHQFDLADIEEALEASMNQEGLKLIVQP